MIERAVVLSTGDELTTGKVADTNSSAIADRLFAIDVEVAAVLTVSDDREKLHWTLHRARELGDLVIGSGRLGPTADDLTTEVVAEFLGSQLIQDKRVAESLKRRFEAHRIARTPNNLKQALFPRGSVIVPNPIGTAPGFRVAIGPDKTLIWLSGVPQEMAAMLNETVVPWIVQQRGEAEHITSCTFKVYGLTESKLDDLVKSVNLGSAAKLSFRANYPDLSLRLMVKGGKESGELLTRLKDQIREALGSHVYCEDDTALEEIVGQLLLAKQQTLALAESCTGGYISHRITRVSGSSAYFKSAAVTYSNEAKMRLGVARSTIEAYGPVSAETARAMAEAIRQTAGTDVGLSVTGVAGPAGGSAANPVGTVWIGMAHPNGSETRHFHVAGDRERVILGASQAALYWLRTVLVG